MAEYTSQSTSNNNGSKEQQTYSQLLYNFELHLNQTQEQLKKVSAKLANNPNVYAALEKMFDGVMVDYLKFNVDKPMEELRLGYAKLHDKLNQVDKQIAFATALTSTETSTQAKAHILPVIKSALKRKNENISSGLEILAKHVRFNLPDEENALFDLPIPTKMPLPRPSSQHQSPSSDSLDSTLHAIQSDSSYDNNITQTSPLTERPDETHQTDHSDGVESEHPCQSISSNNVTNTPVVEPTTGPMVQHVESIPVRSPPPHVVNQANLAVSLVASVQTDHSSTSSASVHDENNSATVDFIQSEVVPPIPTSPTESVQALNEHYLVELESPEKMTKSNNSTATILDDDEADHSAGADVDHDPQLTEQTTANQNVPICLPPNFFPHWEFDPVRPRAIMPVIDGKDDLLAFTVEKTLQAFNGRLNTVNSSRTADYKNKVVDFLLASKDILETIVDREEDNKKQINIRCVGFFSYRSSWLRDVTKARLEAHIKVFDYLAELSSTVDTCKQTIATIWTDAAAAGPVLATDVIKDAFPIIKGKHPKMFKHIGASHVYLTNIKKFDNAELSINVKNMLALLYSLSTNTI